MNRLRYGWFFMRELFRLASWRWWLHPVLAVRWFRWGIGSFDQGDPIADDDLQDAAEEEAYLAASDG